MPFRLPTQNAVVKLILTGLAAVVLLFCLRTVPQSNPPCDPKATLAAQLALKSEELRIETPAAFELSVLLAAHSVKLLPTPEGDRALRAALSLIAKITRGQNVTRLSGQRSVHYAAFGSSGKLVASEGANIHFFNVDGSKVKGDPKPDYRVTGLSWSSDGHFLIMIKENANTQIVELYDGKIARRMIPPADLADSDSLPIVAVAFSKDSTMVVIAGNSTQSEGQDQAYVQAFDPVTLNKIGGQKNRFGKAQSVAISPDRQFVALGTSTEAYVIPLGPGPSLDLLYPQSITAITYSPNGKLIALGTERHDQDGRTRYTVEVFATADGKHIYGPAIQASAVTDLLFANDNRTLASLTSGKVLYVFDVYNPNRVETNRFPAADIKAFAFNGKRLVTISTDQEGAFLQTHSLDRDELIGQACLMLTHNLSRKEWNDYMGKMDYDKLCPSLPE